MIPAINASKIYSTLGNSNSLVPLAIKDIANSVGLTAGSYITGDSLEGKDRFIDEFGTQAIWLFGLPVYKKITDLTLYKMLGIDPKVDVRLLKGKDKADKNILAKAIEHAPTEKIKKSLQKVADNPKFAKNLALTKFGVATALTILSYMGLTKYRQHYRKEEAKKEVLAEMQHKKINNTIQPEKNKDQFISSHTVTSPKDFGCKNTKNQTPAFKGKLEEFMFSPTKNLMIVDGSITGTRFASSESKQEFGGYLVKEGGTWLFMYFASQPIQKWLEKAAERKHKKSIELDARVIESDELKTAFKDNTIEKSLKNFPINGTDVEIYDYINKNPENFVVKMAKKSDIIKTMKDSDKIDTREYIDIEELKGVKNKLEKLHNQFKNSGENLDEFLKKVRSLKRGSVLTNIGACIGALGILVPAIMVALRFMDKDNKEYKVKEKAMAELQKQNLKA